MSLIGEPGLVLLPPVVVTVCWRFPHACFIYCRGDETDIVAPASGTVEMSLTWHEFLVMPAPATLPYGFLHCCGDFRTVWDSFPIKLCAFYREVRQERHLPRNALGNRRKRRLIALRLFGMVSFGCSSAVSKAVIRVSGTHRDITHLNGTPDSCSVCYAKAFTLPSAMVSFDLV
jgi:hypothetical protein